MFHSSYDIVIKLIRFRKTKLLSVITIKRADKFGEYTGSSLVNCHSLITLLGDMLKYVKYWPTFLHALS